ncbi:MAG: plasmid pRiA4b ORF-3 family protein [Anaerolineae bacterium]|nr:plasmid pRiA4b ORF-3 family protein [Anaerolineae bacterium]
MPPEIVAQHQAEVHAALDRLAEFLDNPPPKRPNMSSVELWDWEGMVGFAPADLSRAQDLYRRVYVTGGAGSTLIQESLLNLIAATEDPESIPFWLEILDLGRPRDQFAKKRRVLALAALARLAIRRDVPAAYDGLRKAARNVRPEVRALAVHYLGRAYADAERPLPPEVLDDLADIAVHDTAFGPRFQARAVLRAADEPVPMDNPEGVYAFKVKFMWAKRIYRTIELRSEQTLDALHYAIQRAINWDADHLYSFHVSGKKWDRNYTFACPYEDDHPPWTDEAVIGELGLVTKHKFLYYFDYGNSHEFEVEVVDIRPQAEPGEYPRVVDSRGEAPPQYGWYGE